MNAIKKTIREYIDKNFLLDRGARLEDTDSLLELQIVDSTGFLELVGFIESTYRVKVEDEEMTPANLETIDCIAAFVARKCATSSAAGR